MATVRSIMRSSSYDDGQMRTIPLLSIGSASKHYCHKSKSRVAKLNANWRTSEVSGAGFIGVEWVTQLEYFFSQNKLTITDFSPKCLGPLPDSTAEYYSEYLSAGGIEEFYERKYDRKNEEFWKKIELPGGADDSYVCVGVKASNYFMPQETLGEKGLGGGDWIIMNKYLRVETRDGALWGDGAFFAVCDCNCGCIGAPADWDKGGMHSGPEDLVPGRGAGHPCLLEPQHSGQEEARWLLCAEEFEACVVALRIRHVRHEPGYSRRLLRPGGQPSELGAGSKATGREADVVGGEVQPT